MLTADIEERHFVDIMMGKKFGGIYCGVQSASLCKAEAHLSLSPLRWAGNETLKIFLRLSFHRFSVNPGLQNTMIVKKKKSQTG